MHYEDTGFVDASVSRGKWWNRYWPIDIAMAVRVMLYWRYVEYAEQTAKFAARVYWAGHESNRSGGADNTAGSILATDVCEILRRRQFRTDLVSMLWPRVQAYADEICDEAQERVFGLIKGTNWGNAGNREQGPCYALSTNLLASRFLLKASETAREGNLPGGQHDWETVAYSIQRQVLDRLVFKEDVYSPTSCVFPRGTWAYGILDDGSYMLEPLAGYMWAGYLGTSWFGFVDADSEIREVYDAIEEAVLPLVGRPVGTVFGYASSYNGEVTLLASAALLDKTNYMAQLVPRLVDQLDYENDEGSVVAEISRWAYGGPGDCEDTNLVCVAQFLDWSRYVIGVDDVLFQGVQFRIVPRLSTCWNECGVNDWRVQYLDEGKRKFTTLSYKYQLKEN